MPTRLNKRHQECIREKIRGSQLVNRLESHILPDDEGNTVEMTPTQVNAALGLLKKVVPDLKASEISGPDGGPIPVLPFEFVNADPESPEET